MTKSADNSEEIELARRRIRFRACHRGMREMDLLLGGFADAHLASLPAADVVEFERLLDAQDQDVYHWLSAAAETPPEWDSSLLRQIRAFHTHLRPLYA